MAYNKPATRKQRFIHKRYGERTIPTPYVGGIVAESCLQRDPPCPFMYLVCKLRKSRIHRNEDPGSLRCRYYAPPADSDTGKQRIRILDRERCYFYDTWLEGNIVGVRQLAASPKGGKSDKVAHEAGRRSITKKKATRDSMEEEHNQRPLVASAKGAGRQLDCSNI